MNIPYDDGTEERDMSEFDDDEEVNLELGSGSNPNVELAIRSATTVVDPIETWTSQAKTFSTPDNDPLEVTMTNAAGSKKIYLKIKPYGGLPGGSPV